MAGETRSAWLFDFGAGLRAIVSGRHLVEYLRAPQVFEVPLLPTAARGVLIWREQLVPLLDLTSLTSDGHCGEVTNKLIGAIMLVYRERPASPLQYGALVLATVPREINVSDDLACDLPAEPAFWGALAVSCIHYEHRPTPILRVGSIFTQVLEKASVSSVHTIPPPLGLPVPFALTR